MSLILSIETATKNCSVSLSEGGNVIALQEIAEANFSHAEKLHVFIEALLREKGKTFQDLKAVAISQGPGSYTGLRIGVSSVKGLCYALDLPMIALDTLEVLARQIKIESGIIIPMIDARRMEVFTAVYDASYQLLEPVKALVVESDSFVSKEKDTIHFLGDGASKCKDVIKGKSLVFHDENVFPSAREMAVMAFAKYEKSDFVDVAYFEPFYLKDFVLLTKKS